MPASRSWLRNVFGLSSTRSRPARRRLGLDRLEDRLVPTGLPPAVLIDGPPEVVEFGTYRLNLTAVDPENDPITAWAINWGDGSAIQAVSGNPSTVTHAFGAGPVVRNVTATATVGGETFVARVSAVGTGQTAFHPATTAGLDNSTYMISGRDANGDAVGDLYVSGGDQGSSKVNVYDGATGAFVRTLVSAANGLSRPSGLAFDPDGNLYVSSVLTGSVLRYEWATGAVKTFVSAGSGGLDYPGALTFGPDGGLYVAGQVGGLIFRYDGITGIGRQFADAPNRVADLKFSPDGALYVSTSPEPGSGQPDNRVLRYSGTTGQLLGEFVPEASGGLAAPGALAFGPDGDLYVVSRDNDRVLRYDGQTGSFLGAITGGQEAPFGLTFGPDGDLYVADRKTLSVNSTTVNSFLSIIRYEGPLSGTSATTLPVTVLDEVTATYTSSPQAAIPSDLKYYSWPITVLDAGLVLDVDVTLNITHPNDSDLDMFLVSPAGFEYRLVYRVGGSGDNFRGTILDDEASAAITAGSAPFTGRFRPGSTDAANAPAQALSKFDGEQAQGTWKLKISDRVKANKGTLNSWSLTITRGVGPATLLAAATPGVAPTAPLTLDRVGPTLAEAISRWAATGADVAPLAGVRVEVLDLPESAIGMAAEGTVYLDDNAAGWGWFIDSTPENDSEFRTPDDQGEQGRMDLLSVLTHELGHLLGLDHEENGVMAESLAAGVRETPVTVPAIAWPSVPMDAPRPVVPLVTPAQSRPDHPAMVSDRPLVNPPTPTVEPRNAGIAGTPVAVAVPTIAWTAGTVDTPQPVVPLVTPARPLPQPDHPVLLTERPPVPPTTQTASAIAKTPETAFEPLPDPLWGVYVD